MADQTIGTLPQAASVADDALLVAEIQGKAVQITGSQLKELVKKGVEVYVKDAQDAAVAAQDAAKQAGDSLNQIGDSVTQAGNAAAAAQDAQTAAENAKAAAESAAGSAAEAVAEYLAGYVTSAQQAKTAAEAANTNAQQAKTDAQAASTAAQSAQAAAEGAKTDAQNAAVQAAKDKADADAAKTAALAAQEAAQTAQDAAEASNTAAAGKAAEAAASAATAQQYSGKPPIVQNGNWWTWDAEAGAYRDTGKRAVLGYDITYPTVAAMDADKSQQPMTTAIISSSVEDADNAKLYIYNGTRWNYLTDLSGYTGVGIEDFRLTSGNHAPGTTDVYTMTLTDGRSKSISVYNGADGAGAGDMLASIYDPQGKKTDVFGYVDDGLENKQDAITGAEGQIVGFDADGKPVPKDAPSSLPSGGTPGQVLTKSSDTDFDAGWQDAPKGITGPTVSVIARDKIQIGNVVYMVAEDGIDPHPISDIYGDADGNALEGITSVAAFSPNGKVLVLGGGFSGKAKVYSVFGTSITYVSDIYADDSGTTLDFRVFCAAFSPDGKTLVLGGEFTGKAKVYSVSGTTITYVSTIRVLKDVWTAAFSPDGKALVLGGDFNGGAMVYSVSGTTITYVSGLGLSGRVYSAAFSPDGKTLVLAGFFTGKAKVYSVSGTTITYVSDIYKDAAGTALTANLNCAAFSPDGKALVLAGEGMGNNRVYSVSGTAITYVSNIDNLPAVHSAAFSPGGGTLVIAGQMTSGAKEYSVSGTTITYVSEIYADAAGDPLDGSVNRALAFSPTGSAMVLGGNFTGGAKVYSPEISAYLALNAPDLTGEYKVGVAQSDAAAGEKATVAAVEIRVPGVTSFNGRTGAVLPQKGDYSADDIPFADGETFQQKYDAGKLKGEKGDDGATGAAGPAGTDGKSPFAAAVEHGYTGTEAEFYAALVSLNGAPFLPLNGGTVTGEIFINLAGDPGSQVYLSNNTVGIYGNDGLGVYLGCDALDSGNGYIDGTPAIGFYGTEGDELVRLLNIAEPVLYYDAANKGYVDAQRPKQRLVTLTASGWNASTKQQTVSVSGILADESKQLIQPVPAAASQAAYIEAGIRITGQAANTLTFTADTVPTADLSVYIVWQEVQAG